ncbi:MAG TPA: carboxypeptidase-like regulatory domain-containing protein [Chitinophagaceae bacterium]|jgi:TonB family protein|nr:carboxypeptidase-like regulatory domain-containing protein [Chitinophagaceae bacterium]
MANDNNIYHFTAIDIERYHRGQLSVKQMHDLEKAALDDPFLADALEGYSVAGVNAGTDIAQLKTRLAEKLEGAKIIPFHAAPKRSFTTLRVAMMILFIAGAGLLAYKFVFTTNKNTETAQNVPVKKEEHKTDPAINSPATGGTVSSPTSEIKTADSKQNPEKTDKEITKTPGQETGITKRKEPNGISEVPVATGTIKNDDAVVTRTTVSDTKTLPSVKGADENPEHNKLVNKPVTAEKKEVTREDFYSDKAKRNAEEVAGGVKDKAAQQQNNRNMAVTRKADNNINGYVNNSNTFRGRVVDADNNGVPFANVTNVQDRNAGTFTDARGNFNLTYPDSVLTVQVRSIGFENNNAQLRNSVPNNQVVLQDDRKSLTEVVLSNQNSNAATRNRDANMKLEQPEPVDGWVYYDAYLANNLEVPEDLKNKPSNSGEVQVSFEVDKNGEPANIRVEKSLCGKCDKEAIRLVKEGPKFKRNANKKGRTTVTITF